MIPRQSALSPFCVYSRCKMRTFEVKTLGCKVNQYESQVLRERMLALGFKENRDSSEADIYIVNTCAVTRKAEALSQEEIRKLCRLNPRGRIFVTGCSVENDPEKLRRLEGVTAVLGNQEKDRLADFILVQQGRPSFLSRKGQKHGTLASADSKKSAISPSTSLRIDGERSRTISAFHKHTRAFLKVQDGCDNGCSYCIIPRLRGSSRSRPLDQIIDEARGLAENGYQEIVLCGICLGAYGRDLGFQDGLVELIEAIEEIDGISRIRLSSIEALDVQDRLIEKMVFSEKLCRHLHIPFQSGDDKLLKLMNRKASAEDCHTLIFKLRRLLPDIGLTTDIMVGFPGEEEENFKNTLNFLRAVRPLKTHIFRFSPRRNTAAFRFSGLVRAEVVKDRLTQMRELAKEFTRDFCRQYIGKDQKVLVESPGGCADNGFFPGYSGNYIKVFLPRGPGISVNTIVTARPLKIHKDGLIAKRI